MILIWAGIIHMSKFKPGTVEKNIINYGSFLPEDLMLMMFFSTVPGLNFDMCMIPTRIKIIYPSDIIHIEWSATKS